MKTKESLATVLTASGTILTSITSLKRGVNEMITKLRSVRDADFGYKQINKEEERTVKIVRLLSLLTFASLLCLLLTLSASLNNSAVSAEDHFSVREYNEFHDLLHPLEHEALPGRDFQRIRSNAAELVKRGKAIVRVGVPAGTAEKNREEFRKELKKFKSALGKLSKDAKNSSDPKLEASFSAVHDSFEMLVGLIPRK